MNILIAGGSGFIGEHLISYLTEKGHKISLLTRSAKTQSKTGTTVHLWDGEQINHLVTFDVMINLCGENIANKRWTKRQKLNLLNSRIKSTRAIFNHLKKTIPQLDGDKKPLKLLNASAIGFYADSEHQQDEDDHIKNRTYNFAQKLVNAWEKEALACQSLGADVTCLRFGIVLAKNGGMLKKMMSSFKLGFGTTIGNGKTYLSWVHISDLCRAIEHIILQQPVDPAYNITSPVPCTQQVFSNQLAKAMHTFRLLKIPTWAIKILFGEMGETLMLSDQKIIPKRLEKIGFKFHYPTIESALEQIIKG